MFNRFTSAGACAALVVSTTASGAITASRVVSYSSGDPIQSVWWDASNTYTKPAAALGLPSPDTGSDPFAAYGALTPFNPPFQTSHVVRVSAGGVLELELSAPVLLGGGREIGVFANNGISDTSSGGTGMAGTYSSNPEEILFSNPAPRAIVSVKAGEADAWVPLSATPIVFANPTNYFTDTSISGFYAPLGTQQADFFQPFEGTIADFAGKSYAEMLTLLDGSAGGTWLDISGTGLSSVQYIRFEVPEGENYRMMIDSVTAVPEPASAGLVLLGAALVLRRRSR